VGTRVTAWNSAGKLLFSGRRLFATLTFQCRKSGAVGAGFAYGGHFVASIKNSEVRPGMVIVGEDKQLYYVVDRDLNTPGNWRAILYLKLKNLKTGAVVPKRVQPDD
jgi:hypothetical protein